jgi:hypothetical protein
VDFSYDCGAEQPDDSDEEESSCLLRTQVTVIWRKKTTKTAS